MVNISAPHGTNRKEFLKGLHQEVRENIPESVQDLIRQQIIVVQYAKGVRGKKERDVVMDLAQVLPGIEEALRFAIFLSDFDEIPLARLLRTHPKTLADSVLANSAEIRDLTNFACRPVSLDEKMAVANLVQGYIQPFEGASLVLERDREAINAYEAEYEEAARGYRQEQFVVTSETTKQKGLTADATTAEDLTDGKVDRAKEGRVRVNEEGVRDGGSRVDGKEEESQSPISQKRKKRKEVEDQANFSDSGSSQASASTSKQPPKKRQRTILDPITSEDRNQWITHILTSEDPRGNRSDLLKEFLSTTGEGRKWTILQWEDYIKENRKLIAQQISKITGQLLE
ncbi:hypothetical protein FRC00_002013 [Tulasnella sp. 408]|nr:hypothetical protein FRC00_002013 [Tulasnella sp. 408]